MKTLVMTTAVVTLLVSGTAVAQDTTGNPGKGNQNCVLTSGDTYKSPGAMFRAIRNGTADTTANVGNKPKDTVDQFSSFFESVGDLIQQKCGVEPD